MSNLIFNVISKEVTVGKILAFLPSYISITARCKTQQVNYSYFPKLDESELEETFVRGSGPGGQAVNKTSNCVVLRHLPTNILVKCHLHRSVPQNRKEARKILLNKLDMLYNGDLSIESQKRTIENKKTAEKLRRQKRVQELKKKWIEREGQGKNKDTI